MSNEQQLTCDFIGCENPASTRGRVYGHWKESDRDRLIPVNACVEHAKQQAFFDFKEAPIPNE